MHLRLRCEPHASRHGLKCLRLALTHDEKLVEALKGVRSFEIPGRTCRSSTRDDRPLTHAAIAARSGSCAALTQPPATSLQSRAKPELVAQSNRGGGGRVPSSATRTTDNSAALFRPRFAILNSLNCGRFMVAEDRRSGCVRLEFLAPPRGLPRASFTRARIALRIIQRFRSIHRDVGETRRIYFLPQCGR